MSSGKAHLSVLLMVGFALAGCIGESNPTDSHDECADHAMEPAESSDEHASMEANETGDGTGNDTSSAPADTRILSRQAGNDTGNSTELPEDNEHGNIAESGHHDHCPEAEENPVDDTGDELDGNVTDESDDEIVRSVALTSSRSGGAAPLTVTFTGTVNADAVDSNGDAFAVEPGNFAWTLTFTAEGEPITGDQSSEVIGGETTYEEAGEYTATFEVTFEDGEVQSSEATISVVEPKAVPEQTFFEFGPGLGCAGDAGPDPCLSYHIGESGPFVDAVWIPLDESYVGYTFTSTVGNVRGDSDGWLMDADHGIIMDVNGGGTGVVGTVVKGSAWLFMFSYAEPHTGMTVTFEAP